MYQDSYGEKMNIMNKSTTEIKMIIRYERTNKAPSHMVEIPVNF